MFYMPGRVIERFLLVVEASLLQFQKIGINRLGSYYWRALDIFVTNLFELLHIVLGIFFIEFV